MYIKSIAKLILILSKATIRNKTIVLQIIHIQLYAMNLSFWIVSINKFSELFAVRIVSRDCNSTNYSKLKSYSEVKNVKLFKLDI